MKKKSSRLASKRLDFSSHYSYEHEAFAPPLRIVAAGNAFWAGDHSYSRTSSNIFGIEMVIAGDCSFIQDGRNYVVRSGEVYLLRLGARHTYRVGPSGFLLKRYLVLEGPVLDSVLRSLSLMEHDHIHLVSSERVKSLLKSASRLLGEKKSGFAIELSAIAYLLCIELGRSISIQHPEPVRLAMEFMQQNLNQPLKSSQIRAITGLSMTHFNRLFRTATGVSPVQYFIAQRMAWAQNLLGQTLMSVKEVASVIGYDDPLYFSAQFRKHVGKSPKEYRVHTMQKK